MAKGDAPLQRRSADEPVGRLVLDPDKLGLAAAAFFACLVMALGFYRNVSAFDVLIRLTLTFVVSYTATFILVLVIRHFKDVELAPEEEPVEATENGESDVAETAPTNEPKRA
jgi:hypothetical protein